MNLKNKNIIITGASRGIGLALAKELARKETNLFLVARSFDKTLKAELFKFGALSIELIEADLSQKNEIDKLSSSLVKNNIDIDILINNAGQLTGGLLEEQNPDEIESMLSVNLNAVIRLTRLLLPNMLKRKTGKIVNNSSVSGKMFMPCASTYAAAKAGVVAFTESLKQELRETGVSTLLLITPGVKTNMFDDIEKLYGSHLDLSFVKSIPAESWAKRVVDAITDDKDILMPQGSSRIGVWIGQHLPDLLEKTLASRFKR